MKSFLEGNIFAKNYLSNISKLLPFETNRNYGLLNNSLAEGMYNLTQKLGYELRETSYRNNSSLSYDPFTIAFDDLDSSGGRYDITARMLSNEAKSPYTIGKSCRKCGRLQNNNSNLCDICETTNYDLGKEESFSSRWKKYSMQNRNENEKKNLGVLMFE